MRTDGREQQVMTPKLATPDLEMLERNAERASALLRIIGSKWRLLVVCQLVTGEKTVTDLERVTGLSQSTLSQHLMVLRHRELVNTRRVAQNIYYSLNSAIVTDLLLTLHRHYCEAPGDARPALVRSRTKAVPADGKHRESGRRRAANTSAQTPKTLNAKK
jgi:ArsR family transcriptional regulator, virulence genes transcriptional regulator